LRIALSKLATEKFKRYLGSVITSINNYASEDDKIEMAAVRSMSLSTYNNPTLHRKFSSVTSIAIVGYKDQNYIKLNFQFRSKKVPHIILDVLLDMKEADDLYDKL
jgi:hypothetical protein